MTKKILIAMGYGMLLFLLAACRMDWGHHFSFENQLGMEIDSLEISIGEVKTMILAGEDSLRSLEGNIDVPKEGYPHKVHLKIYTGEQFMILKADAFDCYNCDGSHQYTLKPSGAEYDFLN